MRTSLKVLFAALIAVTSFATLVAQQHPQKPGKWQVTVEMEMPGGGKMQPVIQEICVTEADLADPNKAAFLDPKLGCKVSDPKTKDKTVSFEFDCPSQQMKGNGSITFTGDTFTGETKLLMAGQQVIAKQTGKWLSTCTK